MARVLIIKLGALGDVLVAAAAVGRILERHGNDDNHVMTSPAYAALFPAQPHVEVHTFGRRGVGAMWQAWRWMRRMRFDIIYDLQGSNRTAAMTALSGAAKRMGPWRGRPYTHGAACERRAPLHAFERLNLLLHAAGMPEADPRAHWLTAEPDRQAVEHWLADRTLDQTPFALLHAGSSAKWPSKQWPVASFAKLAAKIEAAGIQVIWIGGPDDRELNARLARQVGVDACGAFSIPQLIALAQRARFGITNDSGPMHALAAGGLPVYAFFGPTDWRRSHAVGQAERVITAGVECSPCACAKCPRRTEVHQCMTRITPEQVMARLEEDGRATGITSEI